MSGDSNTFDDTEVPTAVQPCSRAANGTHWIELELVGEDGRMPIAFAAYAVELPDKQVTKGYLDAAGWIRLENLPAGTCRISFPELDGGAWSFLESTGPKPAA